MSAPGGSMATRLGGALAGGLARARSRARKARGTRARARWSRLAAAVFLGVWAQDGMAQTPPPATLLADRVQVSPGNVIVATGNVEVFVGDVRLRASRIAFDGTTGALSIDGPITLIFNDRSVVLASSAELDAQLRNGIIRSARFVLDQRLQISAVEINRVGGRYTQLTKSIASSCRICAGSTPLWEFRAERIIHDQLERQLYLRNAQLRFAGVPVMYLPRLRLPDPTLKRATGFLVPKVRTNSRLGTGIKLPYFVALGDHADITLTPYVSPRTTTLEARFRRAFRTGRLQFDAAVSSEKDRPGALRAYLFGTGRFDLPRNFDLAFDLRMTSDAAYLLDYGYSGTDRLASEISVTRTRDDDYFRAEVTGVRTLRGSELAIESLLPNLQARLRYEKRFFPETIGGQGSWGLVLESLGRSSNADQVGRDVSHAGARLRWSRGATFGPGLVGRIGGELVADVYRIRQDSTYPGTVATFAPALEAELRWPWVRGGANGAAMTLEPVLHLAWSGGNGALVPNEDSALVEFDEGNLFAISRFPGDDRYERGLRATAGLKWTRYDPQGWSLGLALGRVVRDRDYGQFTNASGLDGQRSDWLAAGKLKLENNLSLTARALLRDDLTLAKTEARLNWASPKLSLASTYSWIVPDAAESRPDATSQMTLNGSYRFRPNWTAMIDYRYDFAAAKPTKATFGLNYTNECIRVDLSLSRRFTASTSVAPTTDVGLSLSLLGFGARDGGPTQSCSGL